MREQKNINQEKIKELAKKKKEMQDELDELKGNTVKGKLTCALAFLVSIGLLSGLFVGMVKLNVGDVAGAVLAPAIGDVPLLRNILPVEMQKKTPSELAAEQKQAETEQAAAEAEAKAAAEAEQAAAEVKAAAEAEQAAAEAEQAAEKAKAAADAKAKEERAAAKAVAEQAAADAKAEEEAKAAEAEQAEAEAEVALQDYADTYSAMSPDGAAKIFESMIPVQTDLVVSIMEKLTPDQRAAILSKMNVANAAFMTEKISEREQGNPSGY